MSCEYLRNAVAVSRVLDLLRFLATISLFGAGIPLGVGIAEQVFKCNWLTCRLEMRSAWSRSVSMIMVNSGGNGNQRVKIHQEGYAVSHW